MYVQILELGNQAFFLARGGRAVSNKHPPSQRSIPSILGKTINVCTPATVRGLAPKAIQDWLRALISFPMRIQQTRVSSRIRRAPPGAC
jgi:hypothetical protein